VNALSEICFGEIIALVHQQEPVRLRGSGPVALVGWLLRPPLSAIDRARQTRDKCGQPSCSPRCIGRAPRGFAASLDAVLRNSAVIEAGFDLNLTPAATLGLSYTGQLASGAHDHGFKANLAVRF